MLSISEPTKSADVAAEYYLPDGKEAYYLNGIDAPGQWMGRAATRLGLYGRTVEKAEFRNILQGFSPDGSRPLVQNAGSPDRVAYWDLTFNAPKSVSVLWSQAPAKLRRELEQAHDRAVAKALGIAESVAGISRRGKGGRIHEKAALLFAAFREGTSRANDPHLHTHGVLANLSLRRDGTLGALHTPYLFRAKMNLGAHYFAELAKEIRQMGFAVEADRVGFRLSDVPKDLCREMSKRRREIETRLATRGESGPIASRKAAVETRPNKTAVPADQLFAAWHAVAEEFRWSIDNVSMHPREKAAQSPGASLAKRFEEVTASMHEDQRTPKGLRKAALRCALELGAGASELFPILQGLPAESPDRQESSRPEQPRSSEEISQPTTPAPAHHDPGPEPTPNPKAELPQPAHENPQPKVQSQEPVTDETVTPSNAKSPGREPGGSTGWASEQNRQSAEAGPRQSFEEAAATPPPGPDPGPLSAQPVLERPGGRKQSDQRSAFREAADSVRRQFDSWRHRMIRSGWKALYKKPGWVEERGRFAHVRWKQPFKHSPSKWLREVSIPSAALELPCLKLGAPRPFPARWRRIHWKKDLWIGELRIQDRVLFPKAPWWSLLHGRTLRAFRFTLGRSESRRSQQSSKSQENHTRTTSKEQDRQSHSDSHSQSGP